MKDVKNLKKSIASTERYNPNSSELYWLKKYHDKVSTIIPSALNKYVLDAGCGYGLTEPILLSLGAKKVDAFDIDKEAVSYCQEKNPNKSLNFGIKDFNKNGFESNHYDLVISLDVLEHLKNYEFYLSNLSKSLLTGGLLFLTTPNKDKSLGLNKFHIKEFTLEEMKQLLERNSFEILEIKGVSSSNEITAISKFIPKIILSLIRNSKFLHKFLVDKLENFHQEDPKNSSELVYLCKKI